MIALVLVFITSFTIVLMATPSLIKVAKLKKLIDEPNDRKIHHRPIPTIGGIMIFAATIFSFALWYKAECITANYNQCIQEFKMIIATAIILFFVGIKDDIVGTAPMKKLVAHIIVGLMLVLIGNIRISGLHGLFGVQEIPYWASIFLSLFTYIVVVNAFNLIDGVDGLASCVGLLVCLAFGTWFLLAGDYVMASLGFSLAGALAGFLIFNFSPARIFMGDSGSLVIGLIVCVLSIKLIEFPTAKLNGAMIYLSKPVFVLATLIYPLMDTLRVTIIRLSKGQSPLHADRNHIHHKLIDLGHSHRSTVFFILGFNTIMICLSMFSNFINNDTISLMIIAITALAFVGMIYIQKSPGKTVSEAIAREAVKKSASIEN
jgi:UDP-GlcNAc:undecaprenyl-phosphate/decaprenyl-phosphate GlcNAc-1-phosphate transferase